MSLTLHPLAPSPRLKTVPLFFIGGTFPDEWGPQGGLCGKFSKFKLMLLNNRAKANQRNMNYATFEFIRQHKSFCRLDYKYIDYNGYTGLWLYITNQICILYGSEKATTKKFEHIIFCNAVIFSKSKGSKSFHAFENSSWQRSK